jgi:hypothetical protein
MASFYDTAPLVSALAPCSPAERSQQNVSRHLRFPNLRHPPALSLHSPEPPGCRTPRPRRPRSRSGSPATSGRASACAPAFPCLVWSRSFAFAFCFAFLVMLDTPDPMATTVVPARMLSANISCRRTQNTHTRPVNCSDSSRRSMAAESTSGRPHLAAEFDEALLLIDVVSVAHLFFIPKPEMCLILRDGIAANFLSHG